MTLGHTIPDDSTGGTDGGLYPIWSFTRSRIVFERAEEKGTVWTLKLFQRLRQHGGAGVHADPE